MFNKLKKNFTSTNATQVVTTICAQLHGDEHTNKNIGDNTNIQSVIDNQEIRVAKNLTDPIDINEMKVFIVDDLQGHVTL